MSFRNGTVKNEGGEKRGKIPKEGVKKLGEEDREGGCFAGQVLERRLNGRK